jgi:hypothetical protein
MSTLNVADYNRLGQVYCVANVAAKNHIAVNATQTGLSVFNPFGSGKKLIIVDWGFVWTTVPAAVHQVGLGMVKGQYSIPTSITALTIKPADGRGITCNSVAIAADTLVYLAAPVAIRWGTGAAYGDSTGVSPYNSQDQIDGSIVCVPGSGVCTIGLTTTAAGMASFTWIEVPA